MNCPDKVDLMGQSVGPIEAKVDGQITQPPSPQRIPWQGDDPQVVPDQTIHEHLYASHLDPETFLEDSLADGANSLVDPN